MAKSSNTENFIEKAKKVHGGKYDYSKVNYIKNNQKVSIICPEHGEFLQKPNDHLNSHGCPKCGKIKCSNTKTYTKDTFIKKARLVHMDKYDYSKVEYINSLIKVNIICHEHGEFKQSPYSHLRGVGCPKCGKIKCSNIKTYTNGNFIDRSIKTHGNKYDYSKVQYVNSKTKVCIICPKHGEFYQTPVEHIRGYGCHICGGTKNMTTDEFIERAKRVHGSKYDYSKVKYINNRTKVCIICPEHGVFYQSPHSHLQKQGCPICKESKLETEMRIFLLNNNIKFEKEKHFKWLNRLSLDFYLPDYDTAIECQGIQHFGIGGWNNPKTLHDVIERDERKMSLCKNNGVKLLYYSNLGIKYPYKVFENLDELLTKIKEND